MDLLYLSIPCETVFMKKIVLLILLGVLTLNMSAQSLKDFLETDNQEMLKNALRHSFYLMRQEFQLENNATGERYNIDSLDYFGAYEGYCNRVMQGFICDCKLLEPWADDKNVSAYPQFSPVLSYTDVYNAEDTLWYRVKLQPFAKVRKIGHNAVFVQDSLFSADAISIDQEYGEKDGWAVWLYKKGNGIDISLIRQKISVGSGDVQTILEAPVRKENLLGGVYLSVCYPSPGKIDLMLAAMIAYKDGKYYAVSIIPENKPVLKISVADEDSSD